MMGKIVISVVLALSCAGLASAAEPTTAAATTEAAAYTPKTEHDNTPWRFNMEQDGKRMTADQFDAWMKSKGVRVAKGPAAATPAAVATPAAAVATVTTEVASAEVQAAR